MNNNLLNIKTPAEDQAHDLKADYGLSYLGLRNLRQVYWNLPAEALYEEIVFRGEGRVVSGGPMLVRSGKHTARAAQDKYIVREPDSEGHIWWGEYNRPISAAKFDELFRRVQGFLQGRDLFVQDGYAGADPQHRLPVRIVTEWAWHSLFARNMFIPPENREAYRLHVPEFTILAVPSFQAHEAIDDTRSSTVIALNFAQRLGIIVDSGYGGEIKKSIFTVMNYLLPLEGVMTMHCSANQGEQPDDVALFFGLSGTGKTTLSADPARGLIGDDEHGWSDEGVFNFEGGCYAKVIRLSAEAEPDIYATTRMFGTVLENVEIDPETRTPDLDSAKYTENTRAAYPIEYINNIVPEGKGGHAKNVIMLTADAFGVLPPISKLTPEQAMYHFISGYTAKVAGTEKGITEPVATFSACFGAPFMPMHPSVYAKLLGERIKKHNAQCWLINTGWSGGPYGVGERMKIKYTRAMLNAALEGKLDDVDTVEDPIFGLHIPTQVEGVPSDVLIPRNTWANKDEYDKTAKKLAQMFIDNFKQFEEGTDEEIINAGPKV